MAQILTTSFTSYSLTPAEYASGCLLTEANIMNMQNLICSAAEEKLGLTFDPTNPNPFIQREAELTGQIGILRMLIELARSVSSSHVIDSDDSNS
jgi:hypothetical protein